MVDHRAVWLRFGPGLYWDAAVRAAHAASEREVVLVSQEDSGITGVDWQQRRWKRKFSLQAFVEVAGQRLSASPPMHVARGLVYGSVRRDFSDPIDTLAAVLDYSSCVFAARDYLRARGLRVSCEHGPLMDYLRRYAVAYPRPVQYKLL